MAEAIFVGAWIVGGFVLAVLVGRARYRTGYDSKPPPRCPRCGSQFHDDCLDPDYPRP